MLKSILVFFYNLCIVVDDKTRYIKGNKKYLVSKIDSIIEDEWIGLDQKIRRRTIKKYIDGVSL